MCVALIKAMCFEGGLATRHDARRNNLWRWANMPGLIRWNEWQTREHEHREQNGWVKIQDVWDSVRLLFCYVVRAGSASMAPATFWTRSLFIAHSNIFVFVHTHTQHTHNTHTHTHSCLYFTLTLSQALYLFRHLSAPLPPICICSHLLTPSHEPLEPAEHQRASEQYLQSLKYVGKNKYAINSAQAGRKSPSLQPSSKVHVHYK
jgi:hypothetical protein